MRKCITGIYHTLLIFLIAFAVLGTEATESRPNILLILADDLGYSDIGCYGGEIRTPNLDNLAANGIRLTQAYNFARCCPTRASLLTGLYPHQTGIGRFTNDSRSLADVTEDMHPGYTAVMNKKCVTVAQVLREAGYQTAASGKWHVGARNLPIDRGFDDFYGFIGGYAIDSWDERMMIRLPEGASKIPYSQGEYFATDAITDYGIEFIEKMESKNDPWFLYLAYQAPHFPVQSKSEDMGGYPEAYQEGWDTIRSQRFARQQKLGVIPPESELSPRSKIPMPGQAERMGSITEDEMNPPWESLDPARQADLAQRMAVFAGMVSGMDRNIGRVLNHLKESGQLENTLIFFLSDNGACAEWEPFGFDLDPLTNVRRGYGIHQGTTRVPNILHEGEKLKHMGRGDSFPSYGSGWANASNTPFTLYKHYAHEGGISTPFIVHWPRKFPRGGAIIREPVIIMDIMATCIEVAQAVYPSTYGGNKILPLEGNSLLPVLNGEPSVHDALFFEHEGNAAIRRGHMKLARQGQAGDWELYDISKDRPEIHNLAKDNPETVREMARLWEEWGHRTNALPHPQK